LSTPKGFVGGLVFEFRGKLTSKNYGVTVDYSKAIRVGRALADVSQRDLSKKISVDPSLVSMIESGRRKPSLEMLQKVADALRIPFHLFTLLASGPAEIKDADPKTVQQLASALSELLLTGGQLEPSRGRAANAKARHPKPKTPRRHP
jgi:transcriptional regulator with XRE-family HTH domain